MAIGNNSKGFGGEKKGDRVPGQQPKSNVGSGIQNIEQSVKASEKTAASMKSVSESNIAHFLRRLANDRNATVEEVSEVIAWATDGNGIIADGVQLAAKKQVERGRIGFFMPSLASHLDQLQPTESVNLSSLLPPSQPNGAKQLAANK